MGSCKSVDSVSKQRKQIVVFLGSNSSTSVNKALLKDMVQTSVFSQKLFKFIIPKLSQVPFFNTDLVKEHRIPQSVKKLLAAVSNSSAVIFITPEYNGAVSQSILNAYEWITEIPRANGSKISVMDEKPIGIMSCSYISQNQINDIRLMTKNSKVKIFQESFYVDLKSNQIDLISKELSLKAKDRFYVWLQNFSRFI